MTVGDLNALDLAPVLDSMTLDECELYRVQIRDSILAIEEQLANRRVEQHYPAMRDDFMEWRGRAVLVKPQFHGPVPADLAGQAAQAAGIIARYGTKPWTAQSCDEWSVQ